MITSIVVAFDGSEAATRALQMGCELALKFDAKLEVSHTPLEETVTYAAEAISGFYVGPTAAHDEMLREAAEKLAGQARDIAAAAGVPAVEVHIGHGDLAKHQQRRKLRCSDRRLKTLIYPQRQPPVRRWLAFTA